MSTHELAPGYQPPARFRVSSRKIQLDARPHSPAIAALYPSVDAPRRVPSYTPLAVQESPMLAVPLNATPDPVSSPRFATEGQRRISHGSNASPLIATPQTDSEDRLGVEHSSAEGTKYSPLGTVYSSSESIPQLSTPASNFVATPKLYNTPTSSMYSPFRPDAESTPANVLAIKKSERRSDLPAVSEEAPEDCPAPGRPRLNPRAPTFTFPQRLLAASPTPTLLDAQTPGDGSDGSSTVRPNGTTPMPSRRPTDISLASATSASLPLPISAASPLSSYRRLATPFADFRWWESVTNERARTLENKAKALLLCIVSDCTVQV